jgi:RNA polymerase sigma-70 factor, ECF subfamily
LERELAALHPQSFGWALSCCGRDREEAEEVLQATYLKILDGRARFEGRSSLKTWLYAVIRKTAAERRRRQLLRRLLLARFTRPEAEAPQGPERAAEESERRRLFLAALKTLAARQREALELVFYHDLTIEEAAAVMGVSLGTARIHYERGKKRLAARLAEGGGR